jgi:hypothetical protein
VPILDRRPSKPDPVRLQWFNVADLPVGQRTVAELEPRSYTWAAPFHLNQGQEGACVWHGITHEAVARPKPVDFRLFNFPDWAPRSRALQGRVSATNKDLAQAFAFEGYDECRRNWDEWPGMNYDGTSAAAGAKLAKAAGLVPSYRWAETLRDFMTGISYHGPGCFAIDWKTGMMKPDSDGFIHPTGIVEGGHQIMCNVIALRRFKRQAIGLWQSWGEMPIWWIYVDEMEEVVSNGGEMWLPVVRSM